MRYTLENNPTVFGKILRGEIPCQKVYEDAHVLAFHDIAPKAPIHVIIIPKEHISGLQNIHLGDDATLGRLLVAASTIAAQLGVQQSGFRLITNAGPGAGQEVPHLHFHLLANKPEDAQAKPLPGF